MFSGVSKTPWGRELRNFELIYFQRALRGKGSAASMGGVLRCFPGEEKTEGGNWHGMCKGCGLAVTTSHSPNQL